MKKIVLFIIILATAMNMKSQEKEPIVLIETNYGNIKIKLYNETPKHRDNFLKLIDEGFFKDLLFHRVIKDFMIQGGDPDSRLAADTAFLGNGDLGYMIDAEFRTPEIFHKRGVLAAARTGDDVNPEKGSSASQFYIVMGKTYTDNELEALERQRFEKLKQEILKGLQAANTDTVKELYRQGDRNALTEFRTKLQAQAEEEANARKSEALFTAEQKEAYKTVGGVPRLDGGYTVYGEVIEGLDVVDKIQNVETNQSDRPFKNVTMNIILLEK
ncbi:peptidylprolyl isomerase [Dysgonomonas sp. ZJ279]|uniref:peptidylprolyl isomerase n=1 Tax=Dysgonomonas sp. ZJ279 TaxID=2709796 RepID=UPI003977E18C